jgi:hypothetical protein
MKTHLYKIQRLHGNQSVKDLLTHLATLTQLQDRNRLLDGFDNRMEDLIFEDHDGAECVLVNFAKLRMNHGPGKASRNSPTTGIEMDDGFGFSEETAALFDLTHGHVIIEYNHHGARWTAMGEYLDRIQPTAGNQFELLPCLDHDAALRFSRLTIVSRVEAKIAPIFLSEDDKQHLPSIKGVLDFAEMAEAPVISVALGGLQGQKVSLSDELKRTINGILALVSRQQRSEGATAKPVGALKVSGKENQHMATQMLDLVNGRVFGEHTLTAGTDKRFAMEDRWQALRSDHLTWRNAIRGL